MDFTSSYGRPIQGVSQQPPQVRQEGQCTEQINCTPSPVGGLKTRVSSSLLAILMDSINDGTKVYFYRRDKKEAYVILMDGMGLPHIFDLAGKAAVVTGDVDYLTNGALPARERFDMTTIGDYTFVVNREINVEARPDLMPAPLKQAVITVAYCSYGRTYKVIIDTKEFSFVAPSGGNPDDIKKVDTTYVATQLKTAMAKDAELTVVQEGPYIFVNYLDQRDFSIKTEDGAGGKDLIATKGTVDKLSEIPAHAPDATYVAVRPDGSTEDSEYYLKVDGTRTDGRANWVETAKAGVRAGMNKDTMPHILVRDRIDPDGTVQFVFKPADWADRGVGNDKSNPLPSFCDVDNPAPITSIGAFQNRLYVTSGENLVTSRTDDYFDFFRFTAQKAVDTDPIDVYSDTQQINLINSSAMIGGNLVLFADNAQFMLSGDIPQTKKTATLTVVSEYECASNIRPVSSGDNLFFAFNYGRYGGVREMYTDDLSGTKRARPVTDHVNKYIEGHIQHMAGSTNINTMFLLADGSPNIMYVYDWIWIGNEKKQSAWYKWTFPEGTEIVGFEYINNKLYVVSNSNGKCILEEFDMSDPPMYNLSFRVRMDRQYAVPFTWDNAMQKWTGTPLLHIPRDMSSVEVVLVDADNDLDNGNTIPIDVDTTTLVPSTTYPLSSDTSRRVTLAIGELIDVTYEPTPPQLRDYKGQVTTINKTILGSLYFNFDHVGHFSVYVEDKYGYKWHGDFNNRRMGSPNNIVGFAPLADLVEEVPVRRLAKDVKFRLSTRTHISMQLRDIEWTGISNPSKRRR